MKVTFFNLSVESVVARFYLLMAIILIAGFSGLWVLGFLALPVFLSNMLGISFTFNKAVSPDTKTLNLMPKEELRKTA